MDATIIGFWMFSTVILSQIASMSLYIQFYLLNGTRLTSVHVDAHASTDPVESISAKEAEPIDVVNAVRFSLDTPRLLHANKKWIKFFCHFWEFLYLVKKASSV